MTTSTQTPTPLWALGDYHAVATDVIAALGPRLVEAAGIGAGQHVLDVAAGTGNAALPAARAGADVVASDITAASCSTSAAVRPRPRASTWTGAPTTPRRCRTTTASSTPRSRASA